VSSKHAGSLITATLGLSDAIMEAGKETAQYKNADRTMGIATAKAGVGTIRSGTIAIRRETIESVASRLHFGRLKVSKGAWRCLHLANMTIMYLVAR
jgi:hypothetical protein